MRTERLDRRCGEQGVCEDRRGGEEAGRPCHCPAGNRARVPGPAAGGNDPRYRLEDASASPHVRDQDGRGCHGVRGAECAPGRPAAPPPHGTAPHVFTLPLYRFVRRPFRRSDNSARSRREIDFPRQDIRRRHRRPRARRRHALLSGRMLLQDAPGGRAHGFHGHRARAVRRFHDGAETGVASPLLVE